MQQRFLKVTLGILILVVLYRLIIILYINPAYDRKNPLHPELIGMQQFSIDPAVDTVIIGKNGTLIRITAHSFTDCSGNALSGNITVFLREFYTTRDIVLSGLTTTTNNDVLETGGMIYLNAQQDKRPVCVSQKHQLGIIIPSAERKKGMMHYTGIMSRVNKNINWVRPEGLLDDTIWYKEQTGEWDQDEMKPEEAFKKGILQRLGKPAGSDDTFFNEYRNGDFSSYGFNNKVNYIFETKKLGWINIARLASQPDNKEASIAVRLRNKQPLNTVFVKLILPNQGEYLQAYKLDDGRYVFGKDLTDKIDLPLGAKGYLLAACYYNHRLFYSMTEFIISDNQMFSIELKETTSEKLKSILLEKF